MKDYTKNLEQICNKLFDLMSVKVEFKINLDEKDGVYTLDIDAGDATGLLIGKRGETLLSIQSMLSFLLKQETGEWSKVVVNVGDYRQKEEEYLKNLAESTAARALETGTPQNLYNLKAWQRRVIHMYLSENDRIDTTSEGEGEDRYLIISPKK